MYNYLEEVKDSVVDYLVENGDYMLEQGIDIFNPNVLYEELRDEDSVTGNASGSYTMNRETAKGYILDGDNLQLAAEAYIGLESVEQFAKDVSDNNYEYLDVTIRIFLLPQAIDLALKEF